jgi:hypothetical protein
MYNNIDDMPENRLREAIKSYEEAARKGELTSKEASRLRELKAALKNITSVTSNRWF